MINLIACVTNINNDLCIGNHGDLIFRLKQDMEFFRNITTDSLNRSSKLSFNVVLMGRKTYYSIPAKYKPLRGRLNFVLTNNQQMINANKNNKNYSDPNKPYYMDMNTFRKVYYDYNPNVFVIGGGDIYNYFLNPRTDSHFMPSKLYITHVKGYKPKRDKQDYTTMINFNHQYKLVGYSSRYEEEKYENKLNYRVLYYVWNEESTYTKNIVENKYLDLASRLVHRTPQVRKNRTGVDTYSIFGHQMEFDISDGNLPLMTVRQIPFRAIFYELWWMMSGNTHNRALQDNGVKIWNGNTSREFLDSRNLDYPEGVLGPGYGWQIRHQGAEYNPEYADVRGIDTSQIGGFDQLAHVEHLLKTDPFSRRILISYWNNADSHKMALLPCHYTIQFYVEERDGKMFLSAMFNMRSSDELARSWNCVFYAMLTQILALRCGMQAHRLIYVGGDVHLYVNHKNAVKEYLQRTPRPQPKLYLSDSLKTKNWIDMDYNDVELIGYFPHPSIKMDMAV
jgi:thymidylate synthase